jgi:hypothetical protein
MKQSTLNDILRLMTAGEVVEIMHYDDSISREHVICGTAESLQYFLCDRDFVVTNVDTNCDGEIRLQVKRPEE